MKKFNEVCLKVWLNGKNELRRMKEEEDGWDIIITLVLLALGLALVAVFIGFKDAIMTKVKELVENFLSLFDKEKI